jgi:hypothetical protein
MPSNAHYCLVVSAPKAEGLWKRGLENWTGVSEALKNHLGVSPTGPGFEAMQVCLSFLTSGRPYVLPLLFNENEAKSFASELTTAGCDVQVVPFGE